MTLAFNSGKKKSLAPPRQPTCPVCNVRFNSRAEVAAHLQKAEDEQHLAIQKGRIRIFRDWFNKRNLSLLSYLANELVTSARTGPITSGQSLRRLINRCYMEMATEKLLPKT